MEEAAQHVTAELVGTEEMPLGEGRGELVPHLDLDRIRQPEAARERRAEAQQRDHDHAGDGGAVASEARKHGRLLHDRRTRGSTAA